MPKRREKDPKDYLAPFRARLVAMALPIPRLAPVTMATLFAKRSEFMFAFVSENAYRRSKRKVLASPASGL